MTYIILLPVFFFIMMLYFRIADHFNIVDKPNERSSHTELTIRGGGIIYLVAALAAVVLHPEYWILTFSLFIIGIISFIDDRITLSSKIRIVFHLSAVSLVFYYLNVFADFPWWVISLMYVLVIGIINAYNFMDGINGITGAYSLIVLIGIQYVNLYVNPFVEADIIWLPLLATVVFLFFNFRTKAKCFAGDVGSVTIALWITFLLLKLMLSTGNYVYILFLAVYGVDSILTIIHRLILKQNIFQAHRLHLYQILANERGISHLFVSFLYALIQGLIVLIVIFSTINTSYLISVILVPLILLYLVVKSRLMKEAVV